MPIPNYASLPEPISNFELSPVKSFWNLVVPETTINAFHSPSFENADNDTHSNTNLTPTYDSTVQFRGLYSLKCTPSSAATSNYYKAITASATGYLVPNTVNTFSAYVKSLATEPLALEVRSSADAYASIIATTTLKTTGGWDRISVTFTPTTTSTFRFFLVKATATTNPYWTDAWQLEPKNYPTTYCDGRQTGCVWLGLADNAESSRPVNVPGGRAYNFKADLGLKVTGYLAAGMPPLQHTSQRRALLGGDFYQRTLPTFRVVSIQAVFDGTTPQDVQTKRERLISYLAPDNVTQQAKQLLLVYQLTDICGNPTGKYLEMPCIYLGGLEGNLTNLNQDKITLQFTEFSPPSIREQFDTGLALSYQQAPAGGGASSFWAYRDINGAWQTAATLWGSVGTVNCIHWDNAGLVWVGGTTAVGNPALAIGGSVGWTSATLGALAITNDQSNATYVGGDFNGIHSSGGNFISKTTDNGATWAQVGATINGSVRGMAWDTSGKLWAVGTFTAPGSCIGTWNGASWAAIGAGLTSIGVGPTLAGLCVARALDGSMIVGGNFLVAGGVTVNYITRITGGSTYTAMGTGMNNQVRAVAVGPDGSIYAGGDFTTAGGITVNYVAKWNGTAWQALGTGLNNPVYALAVGPDGTLYAAGTFTGPNGTPFKLPGYQAKWNGSSWLLIDVFETIGSPASGAIDVSSGGILSVAPANSNASSLYSFQTSVTNAGSAGAFPVYTFTGPGSIYSMINNTTGKALYFNYTMLAGEILTLNTDPTSLSFTSNFYGNIISKILAGSDIASFGLVAGVNRLNVLIAGTTTGATGVSLVYRNTHWAFDASGGSY